MKTSTEIKQRLACSVEVHYYKGQMLLVGIAGVPALLLAVFCAMATKSVAFFGVLGVWICMGGSLLCWYGFCLYSIFRCSEDYVFSEVTLDRALGGWGRGRLCFSVTVRDAQGHSVQRKTRSVFGLNGLFVAPFCDYNNKTVCVGYNTRTDELVVLPPKERK